MRKAHSNGRTMAEVDVRAMLLVGSTHCPYGWQACTLLPMGRSNSVELPADVYYCPRHRFLILVPEKESE